MVVLVMVVMRLIQTTRPTPFQPAPRRLHHALQLRHQGARRLPLTATRRCGFTRSIRQRRGTHEVVSSGEGLRWMGLGSQAPL